MERLSKKEINNRIKLYKRGLSITSIAKIKNRTPATIWVSLKNKGIRFQHFHRCTITLKLKQTEKAYIAGIIDADGYIGRTSSKYGWRVSVNITNKDIVYWLKRKIPYSYIWESPKIIKNYKKVYRWDISKSYMVINFLKAIYPFSIIKRSTMKKAIKDLSKYF